MAGKEFERPAFNNPFLSIIVKPDGSVKRDPFPLAPADADPNGTSRVLSKHVSLDSNKKTWLRLYIPRQITSASSPTKLPIITYYHGGGFVFFSADTVGFDEFCKGMADSVGALVISLDHRMAPEHRLPAAYEDAIDGLQWIKNTQDEWVRDYGDLNQIYLSGTSAGGNIAYNIALQIAQSPQDLEPLKIRGLILHHSYFSGTQRTPSEKRLENDPLLPLYAIDQMFDLSLPEGVDHDHEYCNPLVNGGSKHVELMKDLGWRVLVSGCFGDPLVDASIELAKMLEEKGVETVKLFGDGYHAIEVFDPSTAPPLYAAIKDLIS